jgi:hypothetical protein
MIFRINESIATESSTAFVLAKIHQAGALGRATAFGSWKGMFVSIIVATDIHFI